MATPAGGAGEEDEDEGIAAGEQLPSALDARACVRAGELAHVRSCMRVMHADAHLSLSDLLSPLPHLAPPVLTCVFAESWVMETLKLFIYLVMFIYSFILICICIYQRAG
jgi:hypothetical protein